MKTTTATLVILILGSTAVGPAVHCHAQMGVGTQRGATLGGLGGAIAGAIIGENNDKAGAGAAIGGVVGAVAGGVLGNANDKQRAAQQQQYYYEQRQVQTQIQTQQAYQTTSAVSVSDVINMTRNGLGDSVIINQIQQRGVQQQLQVSDIIALHQQGVREVVITAMQQARVGGAPVVPQTVIVEQPVIRQTTVLPAYPVRTYYPYHHHHRGGFYYGH